MENCRHLPLDQALLKWHDLHKPSNPHYILAEQSPETTQKKYCVCDHTTIEELHQRFRLLRVPSQLHVASDMVQYPLEKISNIQQIQHVSKALHAFQKRVKTLCTNAGIRDLPQNRAIQQSLSRKETQLYEAACSQSIIQSTQTIHVKLANILANFFQEIYPQASRFFEKSSEHSLQYYILHFIDSKNEDSMKKLEKAFRNKEVALGSDPSKLPQKLVYERGDYYFTVVNPNRKKFSEALILEVAQSHLIKIFQTHYPKTYEQIDFEKTIKENALSIEDPNSFKHLETAIRVEEEKLTHTQISEENLIFESSPEHFCIHDRKSDSVIRINKHSKSFDCVNIACKEQLFRLKDCGLEDEMYQEEVTNVVEHVLQKQFLPLQRYSSSADLRGAASSSSPFSLSSCLRLDNSEGSSS